MRCLNLILILVSLISCLDVKKSEEFDFSISGQDEESGSVETGFLDARSYNVRFAKREYIANVLVNIFGDNQAATNLINTDIRRATELFGGTCLFYQENCNFSKDQARSFLSSNTLREGRFGFLCESLMANNNIWNDFLNKRSRSVASELTNDDINYYYQLFYPLESAPDQYIESLMQLNEVADLSNEDKHKVSVITACISPNWQIL